MIPTTAVRLLLVALSITSTANALQGARIGVPVGIHALTKREPAPQETTGPAASDDPSVTGAQATDDPEPTPTPTDDEPTDDPTNDSTEPTPSPTDPEPTPTPTPTPTDDDTDTPTPTDDDNTTSPTDDDKPTNTGDNDNDDDNTTTVVTDDDEPQSTKTITATFTTTRSNGEVETFVTTTGIPSLSDDGNETSGMSTGTRNTIIGVVVGVGGAIILCAIGLVAWRVRNKRRRAEENDGLIGYGGYTAGAAEKPESLSAATGPGGSGQGRTPFQSTLESYHAPTQVNQASNF